MMYEEQNDGSLNIRPHSKITTPEEFKLHINESAITNNPAVTDFLKPTPAFEPVKEEPKRRVYTDKELERILGKRRNAMYHNSAMKCSADFDRRISNHWKKHIPMDKMPEMEVQHRGRIDQLMTVNIPRVDRELIYTSYRDFMSQVYFDLIDLNDTVGSAITEDYTIYSYETCAFMTDYRGLLPAGGSITTDMTLFDNMRSNLNTKTILDDLINSDETRIVNFIAVIARSTISHYRNYEQVSLNSPDYNDVKYIRYTLLLEEG